MAQGVRPQEYWINITEHLIEAARDLKENNLFKVTDGRRIFLTHLLVNYFLSNEQKMKAQNLLEKIAYQLSTLDVLEDLAIEVE